MQVATLKRDQLDLPTKERANLLTWRGQFSPQFVENVLNEYAPSSARVLDPFCGSGTTLIESARLGHAALGLDVNPAAFFLARLYELVNSSSDERSRIVSAVDAAVIERFPQEDMFAAFGGETPKLHEQSAGSGGKIVFDALAVLLDANKSPKKLTSTWARLKRLVLNLPYSRQRVEVRNADARGLKEGDAFNFAITSPPYINVFNYHQNYRQGTEGLGFEPLKAARSEIGANRKHRQNRFLTVTQYHLDMALALKACADSLESKSNAVFVVGKESNVLGTPYFNGNIVKTLAERVLNLSIVSEQFRVFQNRFGADIYEDVLIFRTGSETPKRNEVCEGAKDLALSTLKESIARCPPKSVDMLESAINRVSSIEPSPIYQQRD